MPCHLGRTGVLLSEAIEPSDDSADRFHEWYRNDYIKEVSQMSGWQRTSLFKLVFKKENKNDPHTGKNTTPTWLALHEFQPGSIRNPQDLPTLFSQSESVRTISEQAKKVDVAAFELLSSFGDAGKRWMDVEETVLPRATVWRHP